MSSETQKFLIFMSNVIKVGTNCIQGFCDQITQYAKACNLLSHHESPVAQGQEFLSLDGKTAHYPEIP